MLLQLRKTGDPQPAREILHRCEQEEQTKLAEVCQNLEPTPEERRRRRKRALQRLASSLRVIAGLARSVREDKVRLSTEQLVLRAFPSRPLQSVGAKELLKETKRGNGDQVRRMLARDRFLVYEYDFVGRTALHHAARRNLFGIMKTLLEKNADPNAGDISGRTPLYIAAKYASVGAVKILLVYHASPFFGAKGERLPMDVARSGNIKGVLRSAIKVT